MPKGTGRCSDIFSALFALQQRLLIVLSLYYRSQRCVRSRDTLFYATFRSESGMHTGFGTNHFWLHYPTVRIVLALESAVSVEIGYLILYLTSHSIQIRCTWRIFGVLLATNGFPHFHASLISRCSSSSALGSLLTFYCACFLTEGHFLWYVVDTGLESNHRRDSSPLGPSHCHGTL